MLVYIGMGSNQGDRLENLERAAHLFEEHGIPVIQKSPYYETKALCRPGEEMPDFLNAVFEVETDLQPEPLLEVLEKIEQKMGRTEKGSWKPRPIDLDILFYGDLVMESKRLTIPHPEISKREFVLVPLADLAPDFVHPVLRKTIQKLLMELRYVNNKSESWTTMPQ